MKPGKDNLRVCNNNNNGDDDDLHPNVWVFNSHPLLCSGIHGSWWALTDWEFEDIASSLCSASFIPRQIRNWTHHIEVPLHICMHIRNFHHISQNFWLGSVTWLVGWGTVRGTEPRVTVLASSQVQSLPPRVTKLHVSLLFALRFSPVYLATESQAEPTPVVPHRQWQRGKNQRQTSYAK